ncbi:hypothetical protein SLEP1_g58168 [Rubroshorea leprosula]|uniref:Uncharacterized protein n=1 Tax=Rubroshorea leprosula TaxID=152421 RepID=A0AAV5MQ07_9ROSI|nr:hypothetical protein SLEP1_g58168 [Rubroshorea leprosula]
MKLFKIGKDVRWCCFSFHSHKFTQPMQSPKRQLFKLIKYWTTQRGGGGG